MFEAGEGSGLVDYARDRKQLRLLIYAEATVDSNDRLKERLGSVMTGR